MGGFKSIILIICQVALIIFAAFMTYSYLDSVKPEHTAWIGALWVSNPAKLILGPALAFFFMFSSYGLGRFLWTRLGGNTDFKTPSLEFIILAAIGISIQAAAAWIMMCFGVLPAPLFFFIGMIALVVEITPALENFRSILSPPPGDGDSYSRKALTWLLWPMLIFFSLNPFIWGHPQPPEYLADPGLSFKLTLGASPLGFGAMPASIYARIAGPWAAASVNLGTAWLLIIGMLDASERLFKSRPVGLMSAVLFLCIPMQFEISAVNYPEYILAFFLFAAYCALIWFLFDGVPEGLPLAGLFLGLGLSVSSRGIIIAAVFLIYALIGAIGLMRKKPLAGLALFLSFILLMVFTGSLLALQNTTLTGNIFYPLFEREAALFEYPEPPTGKKPGVEPPRVEPIPPDEITGVDYRENYGAFTGVGYKMTMSTDGDLSKGPQGLGPFFYAFIPGILLIMVTRRHTRQGWTLILLILFFYLFWAYAAKLISLEMLFVIFPFQALLTAYIIDRLYLLSKLEEKRAISYIFMVLFIPAALFTFMWTCPGYGLFK